MSGITAKNYLKSYLDSPEKFKWFFEFESKVSKNAEVTWKIALEESNLPGAIFLLILKPRINIEVEPDIGITAEEIHQHSPG